MPTRTVDIPEELDSFITASVESGRFSNPTEVVAAALRALQLEEDDYNEKLAALRAAIDKGIASGVAEGDIDDVFDRVLARAGQHAVKA
jgi:antitoxin ParD1/3/4